jgi:hypothetical protein
MSDLINNAGLLEVSGQRDATAVRLLNRAPADAVGINVLSPFLSISDTCTFVTTSEPSPSTVFVVSPSEEVGSPVVVHRIALP